MDVPLKKSDNRLVFLYLIQNENNLYYCVYVYSDIGNLLISQNLSAVLHVYVKVARISGDL